MTISVGQALPAAVLTVRDANGARDIALADHAKGKSLVIFAVPGAYTGTCTTAHVPSFIRTIGKFKDKGVDEVICVAVNDSFVMQAWGEATGATAAGITMAADCDASFTKAMGMDFAAGFVRGAPRSLRYAVHAVDGVVKVLQVEENPGQCVVSAGEGMLAAI